MLFEHGVIEHMKAAHLNHELIHHLLLVGLDEIKILLVQIQFLTYFPVAGQT